MMHRTARSTAAAALLSAAVLLTGCSAAQTIASEIDATAAATPGGEHTPAQVVRVVDGDTLIVDIAGERHRIRVLSIDTPETVDPDQPVQCYGPEASAFAHDTLAGQTVTLRSDPTQGDADKYGRLLRYVELGDGTGYAVLAARQGMARPYVYHHNPPAKTAQVQAAADQARHQGAGLWGACVS